MLLFVSPATAGDWTKTDTALFVAYTGVTAVDWSQSLHAARNPTLFKENNPVLGDHPTPSEVNRYFAVSYVLSNAVAYYLPKTYRRGLYVGLIGLELHCINKNRHMGINLSYHF